MNVCTIWLNASCSPTGNICGQKRETSIPLHRKTLEPCLGGLSVLPWEQTPVRRRGTSWDWGDHLSWLVIGHQAVSGSHHLHVTDAPVSS